jgi:hypothetical protein
MARTRSRSRISRSTTASARRSARAAATSSALASMMSADCRSSRAAMAPSASSRAAADACRRTRAPACAAWAAVVTAWAATASSVPPVTRNLPGSAWPAPGAGQRAARATQPDLPCSKGSSARPCPGMTAVHRSQLPQLGPAAIRSTNIASCPRAARRRACPLLRQLGVSPWTGDSGDQVLHHARGPHRLLDGGRGPGAVVRFGLGHPSARAAGAVLLPQLRRASG